MSERSMIRKIIADVIKEQVVGEGKPATAMYRSRIGDFEGQSPVIVVTTSGTNNTEATLNRMTEAYYYDIYLFTAYANEDDEPYDADAVEDTMDEVSQAVLTVIKGIRRFRPTDPEDVGWEKLVTDDRSDIEPIESGGFSYWMERIPIRVEML